MSESRSDKCEICGRNLVYATNQKDYKDLTCKFCGKEFNTNIYCEKGHYICDRCHSKGPIEIIEKICEETNIKDPYKLADLIMNHPNFKVYGPEHHVLTPVVILTILRNNSVLKPSGDEISSIDIKEAIKTPTAPITPGPAQPAVPEEKEKKEEKDKKKEKKEEEEVSEEEAAAGLGALFG